MRGGWRQTFGGFANTGQPALERPRKDRHIELQNLHDRQQGGHLNVVAFEQMANCLAADARLFS